MVKEKNKLQHKMSQNKTGQNLDICEVIVILNRIVTIWELSRDDEMTERRRLDQISLVKLELAWDKGGNKCRFVSGESNK